MSRWIGAIAAAAILAALAMSGEAPPVAAADETKTAIFAGGFMSVVFLGVPYELYKTNTLNAVVLQDFLTGLVKAGVFGLILSALACYHGLSVTGGAAGVGRATTATVVQAVVAVIIADLLFTAVFYSIGWA